jgi:hypothetical protein
MRIIRFRELPKGRWAGAYECSVCGSQFEYGPEDAKDVRGWDGNDAQGYIIRVHCRGCKQERVMTRFSSLARVAGETEKDSSLVNTKEPESRPIPALDLSERAPAKPAS